jgi:ABC-type transport system involved in Fe-S cluster assembly fused permease/ATPase subunit
MASGAHRAAWQRELVADKTVLLIRHRFSTVCMADQDGPHPSQ